MSGVKVGDRVKVTIEGKVTGLIDGEICVETGESDHGYAFVGPGYAGLVETVEPPVEVFKPGDVVRDRGVTGYVRAVGHDGWVNLTTGQVVVGIRDANTRFTSEHYERVYSA